MSEYMKRDIEALLLEYLTAFPVIALTGPGSVKSTLLKHLLKDHLFFYNESQGLEVDLIIEKGGKRELVEIKSSAGFKTKMVSSLRKP